jgi:adenosylmethionine---8-amino-7-oxononanoate aminotransferase
MLKNLIGNEMDEALIADRNNIWHPFTPLSGGIDPLLITSAQGVYLNTHDGRKLIDAISSWWVNIHGHSHPVIAKAVADQAAKLEHVIFAGFTHEPAITLSENLLTILPVNGARIFFSDNGSTAVEVALKMAIQFWHLQGIEKRKVIAIQGAYHGDTFGSMAVGERGIFTRPFVPYLFDVTFIDFPNQQNAEQVFDTFRSHVDAGSVGCFIYEPVVQAAAGMRIYDSALLNRLIAYAQQHGVICIADEVFTGFGRTGKLFASDHMERKPDLIALSKGLTGGTLPLGVTACSAKIVQAFDSEGFDKTFFHGHSFTANPISCAAANASFSLLMQRPCKDNIRRIAADHEAFALEIRGNKHVREARVLGTIFAIELEAGETSYQNSIAKSIYTFFIHRNILIRPLGNVIYVLPPYVITRGELREIYSAIKSFLDQL